MCPQGLPWATNHYRCRRLGWPAAQQPLPTIRPALAELFLDRPRWLGLVFCCAAARWGRRAVPRCLTRPGRAGRQQGLADPGQAGSKCCKPCCLPCSSQMVAAYFRFPPGVYVPTTARSTGTLQISRRLHQGIEFEAVSIRSSSPPLSGTRFLDGNLEVSDTAT